MKKLLAMAVAGLVAAAGISSYLGHSLTQQQFDAQVEALRELAPSYRLSVNEAELTRGVFGSDARIALFFDSPDADIPSVTLLLQSSLQYGPVLFTDTGLKLGLVSGRSQLSATGLSTENTEKLEALIGPHLLTGEHWVDFSRQLSASIQVPAFNLSEDGQRLSFAGIQALINSDLDSRQTRANLTLGSLSITTPEGSMEISPSDAQFESTDISNYMAPSRLMLNIPQISANESSTAVSLQGVELALQQSLENGMINVTESLKVTEIQSPLPLTSASASWTFNGINPKGIELWGAIVSQLDANDLDNGSAPLTEQQTRELISALLQPGLEFIQDYQLSTAKGTLKAHLDIQYLGLANGRHPMDIEDPRQLLNALKAQLNISADQAAIMDLPIAPMVSAYVDQGLLIQDQQQLRLEATLVNAELSVNGQPMPLHEWL